MEHPGITAALRTCAAFERRHPDPDARSAAYDDLELFYKIAVDPRDVRSLSRNVRAVMRETLALAAGVRVRSWHEREVLQVVFDLALEPVFVAPEVPALPAFEATERRDAIVVWAPHLDASSCALYAEALAGARLSVFVIGARGDRVPGTAQFVPVELAGDVLGRAAVIVDASTIDPGWSIALARLGRPMAIAMCAGAQAYLDGAFYFQPWMRGDIALAVAQALGAPAPLLRARAPDGPAEVVPLATIVTGAAGAPAALADAVVLRARGEAFELAFAFGHPFADAAAVIATGMRARERDPVAAYDAFAASERNDRGDAVASFTTIPRPLLETLRQCAFLADRMVYRSHAEAIRISSLLGLYNRPWRIAEPRDRTVPPPAPRSPDGRIVVWTPRVAPDRLGVVRLALDALGLPVTTIDALASTAEMHDALVRAAVVVAPSHDDPGAAVALAAWGIPVCAPVSSGAGEFLRGCTLYAPSDRASIVGAVRAALTAGPPSRRAAPFADPWPPREAARGIEPEVLVIVRVSGGEGGCERTRASIAAQRYGNVSVVEVADRPGRIAHGVNAAVAASSAPYVAVVDAGDELFPDHLALLCAALERSGLPVAYAETLIAQRAPGAPSPAGYALVARRPVEVWSMAVDDALMAGPLRSVLRREELLEAGGWNTHFAYAGDHELFLRLRKRADFVYVERVTSRTERPRRTRVPAPGVLLGEYALLYALHPFPGRPAIAAKRAAVLDHLRTYADLAFTPPPLRLPRLEQVVEAP